MTFAELPAVGDRVPSWFSDQPDGMSIVLMVYPYRGRYAEWFDYVVRLSAPRTRQGFMEVCAKVVRQEVAE